MGRHTTLPTLINDCKTISITKLKEWGYLPNQYKSGIITWSRHGIETASLSMVVNSMDNKGFIRLSYTINGIPYDYSIKLITQPSNLGTGLVWYFVCPQTNKLCRKLYKSGKYYLHRSTINGMYETQTYSHKNRELIRIFDKAFGNEKVYEQLYKKHFKKTYKGKPTKRYLDLMEKIRVSNTYSYEEKMRLFIL